MSINTKDIMARYNAVSNYINNQTNDNWQALVQFILKDQEERQEELSVGDKGWIISPSFESSSYNDSSPRKPWFVQVVEVQKGTHHTQYKVCGVSNLFPNGIDEDSNATAYIKRRDFFTNKTAAEKAWANTTLADVRQRMQDIIEDLETLESFVSSQS
jgi:hypothetical protein